MGFTSMFGTRYKLPVQIIYIILVHVAIGLSVPRLFMKRQVGAPRSRGTTMALGIGAKSLILIGYELVTEHVKAFRKWHSYKANAIIGGLEVVFWGAVAFLIIQANLKFCQGLLCTLSWVVVGIAAVLNQIAVWLFVVAYLEFRNSKHGRGDFEKARSGGSQELHLPSYVETSYKASPGQPSHEAPYPQQQQGRVPGSSHPERPSQARY